MFCCSLLVLNICLTCFNLHFALVYLWFLESSAEDLHVQFCVWVAFYEIYNEQVYDLLQPQNLKTKKRPSLRVCDDSNGNSYVRGVHLSSVLSFVIP